MFVINSISKTNGNNYFEIIGNQQNAFPVGSYFQVRKSTANDGLYRIAAVAQVSGMTRITPTVAIPSATANGVLNAGVYEIDFSDSSLPGKTPVVIAPATYNTTATSLTLPSRGAYDYGERLVENAVRLLENFASTTAPANPTTGQQWFDYTNKIMKTYVDGAWTSDVNIAGGMLTFTDPQNSNSKMVITAAEPTGKTATGMTVYPMADVASGQPILRVLNSAGAVHLAVLRTDSVTTDLRFVSTGSGLNDFKGTVAVGAPTKAFSSGSVLNVDGHVDVYGKVILDESASVHGLVYRTSGSSISAPDGLWTVASANADAASFSNSGQQVALLGTINKFFTPVELSQTLKVVGATTMGDATVTGTLSVNAVSATSVTTATLNVTGALAVTGSGSTLSKQLNVNGQTVTGIATPTADTHAANKKYVDDTNYLSKLSDVTATSPANSQTLVYNSSTSKWVASTLSASSVSGLDAYVKDKAAESVVAGTHVGITPVYDSATKSLSFSLQNQTLTTSGDATGSAIVDWTGSVTIPVNLKASGVTAGTYTKVSVNAKGIVTAGASLTAADIPALTSSKIVGNYDLTNTYKVINAIDPTAAGDYVTLRYLQNYTFSAGTF